MDDDSFDLNDFGSSLLADASTLAGTATNAGSSAIYGDITGVYPARQSAIAASQNAGMNQLLLLILVGLAVYYLVEKK